MFSSRTLCSGEILHRNRLGTRINGNCKEGGDSKLREPQDMEDHLEKCWGREQGHQMSKGDGDPCLSETWKEKSLPAHPLSPSNRSGEEGGRSQAAVAPRPQAPNCRSEPYWVWGPGKRRNGSGQLVLEASSLQADYLMERFLHRR